MINSRFMFRAFGVAGLLAVSGLVTAAGKVHLEEAHIDLSDRASLQRGAGLFMNYCAGCHSLQYQRYSRLAEDLGLTQEQVEQNLIRGDAKFGEVMKTGMDKGDAQAWLGKAPPDLSLVTRAKLGGPDWTYTFLKSFYVDESRPVGWNNLVLANASMPNVLWELQGTQRAVEFSQGDNPQPTKLDVTAAGRLSAAEYDRAIRDITAFLTYVGEPAALKRERIGVWVILFLAFFTLMAWLLKREYWRDIH